MSGPRPNTRATGTGLRALAVVLAAASFAGRAAALNTQLLGQIDYTAPCAGVWGYSAPDGTELAIVGTGLGTSFVDVTDPRAPREVGFILGIESQWREIRTWSHYAYIVTEGQPPFVGANSGLQIVDLADPHNPRLVRHWSQTFTRAHTIAIHAGYAYINGTRLDGIQNGMRILDLANPELPRDVGSYPPNRYVHDSYVHGSIGYLCIIGTGLAIVDLSDRAHPRELSFTSYPNAATHNAAMHRNGRVLYTTDETIGGKLRIWSVFDPADPIQAGDWSIHDTVSIHNVIVQGDSAYVSYYTEGVYVLDIRQPLAPRVVASFDTYPGLSGGYNGCWGVYVSRRTGYIYASDIQSGLFVIGLVPEVPVVLESFEAAVGDGGVTVRWTLHRDDADRGALRLERAVGGGEFATLARFALASGSFWDADVEPGTTLRYRLVLESDAGGDRILAEHETHAGAPGRSRLIGAAPNPAAGATLVRFDLARPGDVWLRVWDARGRVLRSVRAPQLHAGRHAVQWDGRDARGTVLPSGVYFYELQSGAWRDRGRVTLVRP